MAKSVLNHLLRSKVSVARCRRLFSISLIIFGTLLIFTPLFTDFELTVAEAADPWSKQDIALEGVYLVFKALDLGQTLDIAAQPDRYHEINPIIGPHPSSDRVYAYFITTSLLHIGITHFLPSKYRPWFQGVTIGLSAGCVVHNYSIGLRVRF